MAGGRTLNKLSWSRRDPSPNEDVASGSTSGAGLVTLAAWNSLLDRRPCSATGPPAFERSCRADVEMTRGLPIRLTAAAVAVLAVLYVVSVGPYWNISPDSVTYVQVGEDIAEGRGLSGAGALPALTSVIYAPVLYLLPEGYGALNALATLLLLLALVVAFRLIRRKTGAAEALLVVALTLAYTRFFHESTQLLSEPVYMLLTMVALLYADGPSGELDSPRRQVVAGIALILAALTRTVAITLIAAVLVCEVHRFVSKRRVRPVLVSLTLVALGAMLAWEAWSVSQGNTTNFLRVVLLRPWGEGSPILTAGDLLRTAGQNHVWIPAPGSVLANARFAPDGVVGLSVHYAATIVFLAGLLISLRARLTLTAAYVAIYSTVILYHIVMTNGTYRFLIPVAPLVLYYALVAFRVVVGVLPHPWRSWSRVLGVAYVVWFIGAGVAHIVPRVRDEHNSPFADSRLKRRSNFDVQRLGSRIGAIADPAERFASAQRDMIQVLSGRSGLELGDLAGDSSRLVPWLGENRISYVLLDMAHPTARALAPRIKASPDIFEPIERLPQARLYRVVTRH